MREELFEEIYKTLWKLTGIVNNNKEVKLTRREAYLAVRVMDLTEGFIRKVEDEYFLGGPRNE